MRFCITFQTEVTLFGPHDTSRVSEVSESDLHPGSTDGRLHTHVVFLISIWKPIRPGSKRAHIFPEMPVKQGMLFSEDEDRMDIGEQNISGLVAKAKITQFEVKNNFWFTLFRRSFCSALYQMWELCVLFTRAGDKGGAGVRVCGANESKTYRWVFWKPFQDGKILRDSSAAMFAWPLYFTGQAAFNFFPCNFSTCPQEVFTSARLRSSTHLRKYLR